MRNLGVLAQEEGDRGTARDWYRQSRRTPVTPSR